jgi:hypothetical protein
MAEPPSFFNKIDFYGILLPGYLVILVSLFLFRPDLLSAQQLSSFNLLATAVFVVAGPVLGLTLQQTHRFVFGNIWKILSREKRDKYRKFAKEYHRARLGSSTAELQELELAESYYDFNISSAVGLSGVAVAYFYVHSQVQVLGLAVLILVDVLLFVGAYFARIDYGIIIRELIKAHP